MRELAVQAAHGTLTPENRGMIQLEIDQLTDEIHSISRNTEFNRMRILNGEANRVIDNAMWNVVNGELEITRNIVSTTFVSHQVPPGRMNYTIQEAGRGAMVAITPQLIPGVDEDGNPLVPEILVFEENAGITVNGERFPITAGESWESVRNRMNDRLQFEGVTLQAGPLPNPLLPVGPGNLRTYFLVSNIAGSDQVINVRGDLDVFDIDPADAISRGTDARVSVTAPTVAGALINDANGDPILGGLLDVNGVPVAGASLAATSRGNQVNIQGSQGEEIRLNIQVRFNPDAAPGEWWEFPNGDPIDDIGPDGLHMAKDFRTFGPIMLQIGPSHNNAMQVQIPRLNAETLGLVEYVGGHRRTILDVRPSIIDSDRGGRVQVGAEAAINITDRAIQTVSNIRARLGAYQNRLESTVRNLDVSAENTEISRSRIQDTDMARETTRFAQYNVMFQAAMSILRQANQRPQQIIALLQ
jgi:flagellin